MSLTQELADQQVWNSLPVRETASKIPTLSFGTLCYFSRQISGFPRLILGFIYLFGEPLTDPYDSKVLARAEGIHVARTDSGGWCQCSSISNSGVDARDP